MIMSAQEARDLLNLQTGYEKADLSIAFRRRVRSIHPDLLVGSSEQELRDASDLLAQLNMANEVLQRSLRINASETEPTPAASSFAPQPPFSAASAPQSTYRTEGTASPQSAPPQFGSENRTGRRSARGWWWPWSASSR